MLFRALKIVGDAIGDVFGRIPIRNAEVAVRASVWIGSSSMVSQALLALRVCRRMVGASAAPSGGNCTVIFITFRVSVCCAHKMGPQARSG